MPLGPPRMEQASFVPRKNFALSDSFSCYFIQLYCYFNVSMKTLYLTSVTSNPDYNFHIAAKTTAAAAGLPSWLIKILGCCWSHTYERYVHLPGSTCIHGNLQPELTAIQATFLLYKTLTHEFKQGTPTVTWRLCTFAQFIEQYLCTP